MISEQEFTKLVNAHKERLYWQIRRIVISHDDADDVLQNTFIKAWTALDTFRGDSQISSWLYRIAQNEALNFLEKKARQGEGIDADALAEKLESDPYFDGGETEIQLQQAIARLPERQRQVFCLKYFDEMPYDDMSRVLGATVGALKASYHHAVKKIEEYFDRVD